MIGIVGIVLLYGMEYFVSGFRDVMYGKGFVVLIFIIIESLWDSDIERFGNILKVLGGICVEDCLDVIRNFFKKIDLDIKLSDLGIEKLDIDWLIDNCMKILVVNIKRYLKYFNKE